MPDTTALEILHEETPCRKCGHADYLVIKPSPGGYAATCRCGYRQYYDRRGGRYLANDSHHPDDQP